jgi:carbon monoxide dehydrogenase subunit G
VQLEHTFTVPAPMETVWQAVLDPARVAPCMPGATLTSVEGDTFAGTVKVKLGPISLLYKGSGEFLEKDEAARTVVIKASGKDSRGNGTAAATVTLTLTSVDGGTEGTVVTDLAITGRPAQFGRGLIAEVGGKILNVFATCLADRLDTTGESVTTSPAAEPVPSAAEQPTEDTPSPVPLTIASTPVASAEPVDLMEFAAGSVAKRLIPVLAVLLVLAAVIIIRKRRT